ncbi:hypothetical protein [Halorarius litoreus]|uniref:hypothetical protein n=1 Tax=Halorarius litoreus TaxID=2962676 RepID=UPI0020CF9AA0|nr:hypothetical protein [Halorarius litoreus]
MADDMLPFGLTLGALVVGLAILILGVMQNNGQALNGLMIVGGAIAAAGMGVLVTWIGRLEPA